MTFPVLNSLPIITPIYLTIFLSWVDGTVFPTASQLEMSQFPMYSHTVDVTDISPFSRTMLTWRKCFGPQESIYSLVTKHPRSKLLILINRNEHKGCEFVQIFDYVKKRTNKASVTKSAEKQLHICSIFASSKVSDLKNEAIVPSLWNTLRTLKSLRYASSGSLP